MKKKLKKVNKTKEKARMQKRGDETNVSNNEIGLSEDVRVVYGEEPNPDDG